MFHRGYDAMCATDQAVAHEVEKLAPLAERIFDDLRSQTSDGVGITRASYGDGEQKAFDIFRGLADELEFAHTRDAAGNLIIVSPGDSPDGQGVVTGSHLDSVPCGGNYDGAAGVAAGLIALEAIRRSGIRCRENMTAVGLRGEESAWFAIQHIGSRAALGVLPARELETARRFDTGRSLAEHMAEAGCDLDVIRVGQATFDAQRVKAFFELHIEQGPVLVDAGIPVAIVTGIRGNLRCREGKVIGTYAHSGAVPRKLRNDAVLAAADLAMRSEQKWVELEAQGRDLVFTLGKFETNADLHSHNKVPGEVFFTLDARSHEVQALDEVESFLKEAAESIARDRRVEVRLDGLSRVAPQLMSELLQKQLAKGATELSVPFMALASGGGHDAADFARAGIPAAMIFVRNPHGSHNPHESMSIEDFIEATKVLASGLLACAA